jgi:hypothetical protein
MSFSAALFPFPMTALPYTQLVLVMVQLTLLGGVLMFFRPLLVGILRALVLVVRPRLTKDELAARRKLRAATLATQSPAAKAKVDVPTFASRV